MKINILQIGFGFVLGAALITAFTQFRPHLARKETNPAPSWEYNTFGIWFYDPVAEKPHTPLSYGFFFPDEPPEMLGSEKNPHICHDANELLDLAGKDGWELVNAYGDAEGQTFFFKRQLLPNGKTLLGHHNKFQVINEISITK